MSDCDTCVKARGLHCQPSKDGSCAWWEQDPDNPLDRFGIPVEQNKTKKSNKHGIYIKEAGVKTYLYGISKELWRRLKWMKRMTGRRRRKDVLYDALAFMDLCIVEAFNGRAIASIDHKNRVIKEVECLPLINARRLGQCMMATQSGLCPLEVNI